MILGTTHTKATRDADEDGKRIANYFGDVLRKLLKGKDQFKILRWKDILGPHFNDQMDIVHQVCVNDPKLQTMLRETAEFYIKKRNLSANINEYRRYHFSQYLLMETVGQIFGFRFEEQIYRIFYHPVYVDGDISQNNYHSPVLTLKNAIRKALEIEQTGWTLRIFVRK